MNKRNIRQNYTFLLLFMVLIVSCAIPVTNNAPLQPFSKIVKFSNKSNEIPVKIGNKTFSLKRQNENFKPNKNTFGVKTLTGINMTPIISLAGTNTNSMSIKFGMTGNFTDYGETAMVNLEVSGPKNSLCGTNVLSGVIELSGPDSGYTTGYFSITPDLLPNGIYTVKLYSGSIQASIDITIDNKQGLTIVATPDTFSPKNNQTTSFRLDSLSGDEWSLNISGNSSNFDIAVCVPNGASVTWNGRNNNNVILPDGAYKAKVYLDNYTSVFAETTINIGSGTSTTPTPTASSTVSPSASPTSIITPTPNPTPKSQSCSVDIYSDSPQIDNLINSTNPIPNLLTPNSDFQNFQNSLNSSGFKTKSFSSDIINLKNKIDQQMISLNQQKEDIRNQINQVFGKEISKNEILDNLSFEQFKIKISDLKEFFYYRLWRNSYDVIASYEPIVNEINLYEQLWKDYSNNKFSNISQNSPDNLYDNLETIKTPLGLLRFLANDIQKNLDTIKDTNKQLKEDISLATENITQFGDIETNVNNFFSKIPPNILQEMINYYESQKSFSVKMAGQQLDPDGPTDGLNVHGGNAGSLNPKALAETAEKLIQKATSEIENGINKIWDGEPKTPAGKSLANNVGKLSEEKALAKTLKDVNQKNLNDSIKRTQHGQERTEERPGPDQLKTIKEGKQYVQPDGKKVYVDGTHVVITGREGGVVTTRNNLTKSVLQKKVREGTWKPVDKETGLTKQNNLNSIFDKINRQRDCKSQ